MREARPHWTQMQGKAGEYAVCSQLCLHGHIPCLPSVDYGFDIMLDNGLKIQVKSARLRMGHPAYPNGVYRLEVRENIKVSAKKGIMNHLVRKGERDWSFCDFFVFWLVDEDRFLVVPCSEFKMGVYFVRVKGVAKVQMPLEKLMEMRDSGMTYGEIADELGVHKETIYRKLKHGNKFGSQHLSTQILQWEDRWDLLDVGKIAEELIESTPVANTQVNG